MNNAEKILTEIREKMENAGQGSFIQRVFASQVERVLEQETSLILEEDISPIDTLPSDEHLEGFYEQGMKAMRNAVMIKLNGGLGTGMGLSGPKSLLPVKDGLHFLDIIARQIIHAREHVGVELPVLFMNSFSTDEPTLKALARYPSLNQGLPLTFLQHKVPKLHRETLMPVEYPENPDLEWCPPGHGDIYTALQTGGMLEQLLAEGVRYAFVSNVDNLGATLDPKVLGYFADTGASFMMEVARRTPADRKGGHLAYKKGGGLILRESAQCRPDELDAFQDIAKHAYFNTNNLWIRLDRLKEMLDKEGGIMPLALIQNRKTVNPRDAQSTPVLQLETAMGAAIAVFEDAQALCVSRKRFAPIKTTDDLLGLRSNAYVMDEQSNVVLAPERNGQPVVVHLDSHYYKKMDDFDARFQHIPDLLDCTSLNVEGDVWFGPEVVCKGDVRVQSPQKIKLDKTVLEGNFKPE